MNFSLKRLVEEQAFSASKAILKNFCLNTSRKPSLGMRFIFRRSLITVDEYDSDNLKPVNIAEIIEVAGVAYKKLTKVFCEAIENLGR